MKQNMKLSMALKIHPAFKCRVSSTLVVLLVTLMTLSCQQVAHACCPDQGAGVNPSHCGEAEQSAQPARPQKIAPCCVEQQDISVLSVTPTLDLPEDLPTALTLSPVWNTPLVARATSLSDQVFIKNQSHRYLELRVLLN